VTSRGRTRSGEGPAPALSSGGVGPGAGYGVASHLVPFLRREARRASGSSTSSLPGGGRRRAFGPDDRDVGLGSRPLEAGGQSGLPEPSWAGETTSAGQGRPAFNVGRSPVGAVGRAAMNVRARRLARGKGSMLGLDDRTASDEHTNILAGVDPRRLSAARGSFWQETRDEEVRLPRSQRRSRSGWRKLARPYAAIRTGGNRGVDHSLDQRRGGGSRWGEKPRNVRTTIAACCPGALEHREDLGNQEPLRCA